MNIDSGKEADGFVTLKRRKYPLIVTEAGWSESERDLREDARLWLWGTEPPVQFVIVVEHVETKFLRDERLEEEEEEGEKEEWKTDEILSSGEPIELRESVADDDARQRAWAKLLLQLHSENKLMKPLLGSVRSTLYIYRRKRNDDDDNDTAIVRMSVPACHGPISKDIYCHFETEIYPKKPKKEVKLQWRDILGGDIPQAFTTKDLEKYFRMNLEEYHNSVEESIDKHIMWNANRRAVVILERRNDIPRLPSHAEQKRGSGPNMLEGQAADGPYVPSSNTGSGDGSSKVSASPRQKWRKRAKV
jgi:hypothetical protein